jgi:hypothetical protein
MSNVFGISGVGEVTYSIGLLRHWWAAAPHCECRVVLLDEPLFTMWAVKLLACGCEGAKLVQVHGMSPLEPTNCCQCLEPSVAWDSSGGGAPPQPAGAGGVATAGHLLQAQVWLTGTCHDTAPVSGCGCVWGFMQPGAGQVL